MMISSLKTKFEQVYKYIDNTKIIFAPGRVNLIGEHTDYNGGKVFPAALDIGTYIVISPRSDNKMRFFSSSFSDLGIIELDFNDKNNKIDKSDWVNYPIGVIVCLEREGFTLNKGFDVFVEGNIPYGAGLSSSASLGVAFVKAFDELHGFNIDGVKTALIAQKAEHYAGTMCGIMDQFASSMGKENHGILLDCNTLEYKYAPVNLGDYELIIMNSNKTRALNESKYNERRAECEEGLKILKEHLDIDNLGNITEEQYYKVVENVITDPTIKKRVKHAIFENIRTDKAFQALENGDLKLFGQLLNESHYSLQNDYEVSGIELDVLTGVARDIEGVLGSRMTGAGFGGCAIALVLSDKLDLFKNIVFNEYKKQTGYEVQFIPANIKNGVTVLA